jgi:hypothetical protein
MHHKYIYAQVSWSILLLSNFTKIAVLWGIHGIFLNSIFYAWQKAVQSNKSI